MFKSPKMRGNKSAIKDALWLLTIASAWGLVCFGLMFSLSFYLWR